MDGAAAAERARSLEPERSLLREDSRRGRKPADAVPAAAAPTSELEQEADALGRALKFLGRGQPARALDLLEQHQRHYPRGALRLEVRRFPEGTKTAPDAARAVGCEVGQIVKSLVFMADGEPLLALTSGANRADTAKLASWTGAREVRRATADEARAATGFAIGGTPPFGFPGPVRVLMDEDLVGYEEIWAAAGTPSSSVEAVARGLSRLNIATPTTRPRPGLVVVSSRPPDRGSCRP